MFQSYNCDLLSQYKTFYVDKFASKRKSFVSPHIFLSHFANNIQEAVTLKVSYIHTHTHAHTHTHTRLERERGRQTEEGEGWKTHFKCFHFFNYRITLELINFL